MRPVLLLSGFMGGEEHWGEFPQQLAFHLGLPVQVFNWSREVTDARDLAEAARRLIQRFHCEGSRPILVGYSMGARLALQCALEGPGAISAVAAVSAHVGLTSEAERSERRRQDIHWANLLREDAVEFWKQWNQQPIWQATQTLPMPELTQQQRLAWANLLEKLSTGAQNYLPPLLAEARVPLWWAAGEQDEKYAALKMQLPANVATHLLSAAGHRVPLDAPVALAQLIAAFIRQQLVQP